MKELELSVLWTILDSPELAPIVTSKLTIDHFTEEDTRYIFIEIRDQIEKGLKPSIQTISKGADDEEKEHFIIPFIDARALADRSPDNLDIHIQSLITEKAKDDFRAFVQGFDLTKIDEADNLSEVIQVFIDQAGNIMAEADPMEASADVMIENVIREYRERDDDQSHLDLFGLPSVDRVLTRSSFDLTVLMGLGKSGKSALATAIAVNHAKKRRPFCYRTAELDEYTLTDRHLAAAIGVPMDILKRKKYLDDPKLKTRIEEEIELLRSVPGAVMQSGDLSIPIVVSLCYSMVQKYGTRTFIFDRIDLFEEVQNAKNEFSAIRMVSRKLRRLARQLRINIVLIYQSGNDAARTKTGRIQAHNVWGGTSGQTDSTRLIGIHNPFSRDKTLTQFEDGHFENHPIKVLIDGVWWNMVEVGVLLNTFGISGASAKLAFNPSMGKFIDLGETKGIDKEVALDDFFQLFLQGRNLPDRGRFEDELGEDLDGQEEYKAPGPGVAYEAIDPDDGIDGEDIDELFKKDDA